MREIAPLLIGMSLAIIVLAQYRALLITMGFALLLTALIIGRRRSRGLSSRNRLLAFMAALVFGAAHFPS